MRRPRSAGLVAEVLPQKLLLLLLLHLASSISRCQAQRRVVEEVAMAQIYSGLDFAQAVANPNIGTMILMVDVVLSHSDWAGIVTPVLVSRNLTLEGDPVALPNLRVINMNWVSGKVRLGDRVVFTLRHMTVVNYRLGNHNQAPGMDLLAACPPNSSALLRVVDCAGLHRVCYPPALQKASLANIPRPASLPGNQSYRSHIPQPGCVYDPLAPPIQRCWPHRGSYDDVGMPGVDLNENNRMLLTRYDIHMLRVTYMCDVLLTDECVQDLGALGCAYFTYARLDPPWLAARTSFSGPTSLLQPRPSATAATQGSAAAGPQDPKEPDGGLPVGAVVGGAVGGLVVTALAVSGIAVLVLRRRRRRKPAPQVEPQPAAPQPPAAQPAVQPAAQPPGISRCDADWRYDGERLTPGPDQDAGQSALGILRPTGTSRSSHPDCGAEPSEEGAKAAAAVDNNSPLRPRTPTPATAPSPRKPGHGQVSGTRSAGRGELMPVALSRGSRFSAPGGAPGVVADPLVVVTPLTPHRTDVNLRLVIGCGAASEPESTSLVDSAAADSSVGGGTGPPLSTSDCTAASTTDGAPSANSSSRGGEYGGEVKLLPVVRGRGSYGKVVEGTYQGGRVAVKLMADVLGAAVSSEGLVSSFAQEVEVLARCRHPHVVRLLAACMQPPRLCLVMELMDTSLEAMIRRAPGRLLLMHAVLGIALDVARGLEYLHPTIVHRDLKPANVLVSDPLGPGQVAKLSDFGLARLRYSDVLTQHPEAGTPSYMAPECFDATIPMITFHVDIYALGILLWVMLTGHEPWEGLNMVRVAYLVTYSQERPPLGAIPAGRRHPKLLRLIQSCWEADPRRRPAAAEAVKELMLVRESMQHQEQQQQQQLVQAAGAKESSSAGNLQPQPEDDSGWQLLPDPEHEAAGGWRCRAANGEGPEGLSCQRQQQHHHHHLRQRQSLAGEQQQHSRTLLKQQPACGLLGSEWHRDSDGGALSWATAAAGSAGGWSHSRSAECLSWTTVRS